MAKQDRKVALVTGATKGMGRAIALQLASTGYDLLLVARSETDLITFSATIRNSYPETQADCCPVDLSHDGGCGQLLEWLNTRTVHVLVNNLGVFHPVSVLDETEDDFMQQWQINYITPYRLSRAVARKMVEQGYGHIINITSVAARNPIIGAGTYSVTKAALRSLTHVLREELRQHDVRVAEIVPGSTKTASWSGTTIPDDRFVMPEDIARAVEIVLRASEGASVDEVVVTPRLGNI